VDKPRGHRGAKHSDAQAAVRQRLIVIRDRVVVGGNAERGSDIQSIRSLRQLPEPAVEAVRIAAREHDLVAVLQPQRGVRDQR
jgi:hypothetical protein